MKRKYVLCSTQDNYDEVAHSLLVKGLWEIDPVYEGKPIRLENALVFPLVYYESEEERPKPVEAARKPGEFDDVVDVKSVEFAEVEAFVKQGYVVQSLYAKNVLMIKRVEAV